MSAEDRQESNTENASVNEPTATDSAERPDHEADRLVETSSSDAYELAEIDRLYRQGLDAVEAVAADLNSAVDALRVTDEPNSEVSNESTSGNSMIDGKDPIEADARQMDSPLTDLDASRSDDSGYSKAATRVTPRQVIEAALFVGGEMLTTKRISSMLRGEFDQNFVEATIDDLNEQFTNEGRPYEVRFGEGGYKVVLKEEFEPVRNRVFGIGPKEVKLSQDVLEVLSLIAYRQPISREDVETLRGGNAGGVLGQLLRRELLEIERDPDQRKLIRYRTTPRFLQVFGLSSLDELPRAEDLSFK